MEQALRNILDVVQAAGGQADDIVRLTWYVTDKTTYLAHQREVGEVYRKVLGPVFPGDDDGRGLGAGRRRSTG